MADPERCPIDDFSVLTAGGFYYFRLHGSPDIYRSQYTAAILTELAGAIAAASKRIPGWCIFDNTAIGHATGDAASVVRKFRTEIRPRILPDKIR